LRRSPSLPAIVFLPLSAPIKKRLAAAGKDGARPQRLSLPPGKMPGVKIEAVKSAEKYIRKKAAHRAASEALYTAPAIVLRIDEKAVWQATLIALP
jgi:hypothetical protein